MILIVYFILHDVDILYSHYYSVNNSHLIILQEYVLMIVTSTTETDFDC